jgi:nickel-dependent lactate racemase
MNEIVLFSDVWNGDKPMTIKFPASWEVTVVGDGVYSALSSEMIRERFSQPIGSSRLSDLALGKKRVAVIVDDITRPTPSATLIPFILEDLRRANIQDEAITIVIAAGTHEPAAKDHIIKKVGNIPPSIKVISHDCKQNLKYMGQSSRGTPIYINETVMGCDLKIGVGCIYPHGYAGFSGGSKIILPGVSGRETAGYIHGAIQGAKQRGDSTQTDFRRELEEVARIVGLDFIANVVLNQQRQIAGLFVGDRSKAHQAGVEFATKLYTVRPIDDADIVIADVYPFDAFLFFAHDRGLWSVLGARDDATTIAIAACSMGLGHHELFSISTPVGEKILRRLKNFRPRELCNPIYQIKKVAQFFKKRNRALMVLSQGITPQELKSVFPYAKLYKKWDELLPELESRHNNLPVKVVVYRCAPFLIPA